MTTSYGDDGKDSQNIFTFCYYISALLLGISAYYSYKKYRRGVCVKPENTEKELDVKVISKNLPGPSTVKKAQRQGKKKVTLQHEWLAASLRGHQGIITDFSLSPNQKYLLSCAEDRSLMVWNVKEFGGKDRKSVRGNVKLDHAIKIAFAADSKHVVMALGQEQAIRVLEMSKRDSGVPGFSDLLDFGITCEAQVLCIGVGASQYGRYIMVAFSDTTICLYRSSGELLAKIDSMQLNNTHCDTSPCGRFVACSGFTSDVRSWEVEFDKTGNFRGVKKTWALKGHHASIHHFSFSPDSSKVATVSKDRTWRIWNIDVEYKLSAEPQVLQSGEHTFSCPCFIALCPDTHSLVLSSRDELVFYSASSKNVLGSVSGLFSDDILGLTCTLDGRYIIAAGTREIYVFNNVPGLQERVSAIEKAMKTEGNKSLKERLSLKLEEARNILASYSSTT